MSDDDTYTGTVRAWVHLPEPDRLIMSWPGGKVMQKADGSRYMVLDYDPVTGLPLHPPPVIDDP